MKILVCISHVPDTTSKINFTDNNSKFDKNGVQFVINPNDEFGLTRAMWLKEKQGASVDVINVGLSDTEPTLRKALAIGADKAIRINTEPKNGLNVAKQVANLVKSENYDLVIGGRESIDYNGGMVPGMIEALTDYNFVDKCISIEINNGSVIASREIEGGIEIVDVMSSAITNPRESKIGVSTGVNNCTLSITCLRASSTDIILLPCFSFYSSLSVELVFSLSMSRSWDRAISTSLSVNVREGDCQTTSNDRDLLPCGIWAPL